MTGFFDDFFDEFFSEDFFKPSRRYMIKESTVSPLTDLWQEGDKLIILFDLPGTSKESIDLRVTSENLTLTAKAGTTTYYKKLVFPVKVLPEKAKTSFKNGVLELILPVSSKKLKIT